MTPDAQLPVAIEHTFDMRENPEEILTSNLKKIEKRASQFPIPTGQALLFSVLSKYYGGGKQRLDNSLTFD